MRRGRRRLPATPRSGTSRDISPLPSPSHPCFKSQKRLVSPDLIRVIKKPFEAGKMALSAGKGGEQRGSLKEHEDGERERKTSSAARR